jgi:hypothetical protein
MATKRPDGRVEPGQRISSAFSARAWNRAQDAADVVLGARTGAEAGASSVTERASNIILVRNLGLDVPMLGVLALGAQGILIDPTGGTIDGTDEASEKAREFVRRPVLNGSAYNPEFRYGGLCICLEPIASNKIGRAAVGGVVSCFVNITNQLHTHAGLRPGDNTQLLSSACGPVRLLWKEDGNGLKKWAVGVF